MTTAISKPKTTSKRKRQDPREAKWLELYFGNFENEGRGNAKLAAISAGYDESKADAVGRRLERELEKRPLIESLRAAGITRPKLALMLQEMSRITDTKERRLIVQMLLEVMGETKDDGTPTVNVTGQGAQILIVAGASDERLKRLKKGQAVLPAAT